MSRQSIAKRIEKLEGKTVPAARVFQADDNGIIPDEFEPEADDLIVITFVSPDGNDPKELNPPLKWRGQTFERGEPLKDAMLTHQHNQPIGKKDNANL